MRVYVLSLIFLGSGLLVGCSDTPPQPETGTGVISAFANDRSVGPVADVEVTLRPNDLSGITDDNGRVSFEVPVGDYFVDARLCCAGPGFFEYHVPVTVTEGKTVEVELLACLRCQ